MPKIKSFIQSLFSAPTGVPIRLQRYFVATNSIYVLALLIHFVFIFFFWGVSAPEMMYFNMGSVGWFCIAIWVNRKKFLYTSLYLCFTEVFLHGMVATFFFGWGAGYEYYMLLFATGVFLLPPGRNILKFSSILITCLLFAGTYFYSQNHPPVYLWSSPFLEIINVSNIVFSSMFHAGFAYYFTWAANDAENSLEKENEAQKAFFQNISHELRTPLTLISGPTENAIKREENLSPEELKMIAGNSRRLTRLVNQLLDIQKITSGKMQIYPTHVDLGSFVEKTAEAFKPYVKQKSIQFEVVIPKTKFISNIDVEQLDKCLYNYLSNAIKFTPEGKSIKLEISEYSDSIVEVSVIDTGVGIEPEQVTRLFSRFGISKASLTREQEGTGLGLSLVKELVELHGGTVGVESTLGIGSKFYFRLPYTKNGEGKKIDTIRRHEYLDPENSIVPIHEITNHKTSSIKSAKILVVEDNSDLRSYVGSILGRAGYSVLFAVDGQEGLSLLFSQSPDLVLTDLMMPKISGMDLIREAKKNEDYSTTPIILLTAKADEMTRAEVRSTGADFYLAKPFREDELLAMIRNALTLKRKEKDLIQDRNRASLLQKKLLPSIPRMSEKWKLDLFFQPAEGVAGDSYYFHPYPYGELLVLLLDVSGHGMASGMVAAMVHLALTLPDCPQKNPAELCKFLNKILLYHTGGNFLTCVSILIDPKNDTLKWAKAGQEGLYLFRKGNMQKLISKGKPIGLFQDIEIEEKTISLEKGDRIFLCSDGISEATDPKGTLWLDSSFEKKISELSKTDFPYFLPNIIQSAKEFSMQDNFEDDVTMIVIDIL